MADITPANPALRRNSRRSLPFIDCPRGPKVA
jgi:hypothetical protein